MKKRLVFALFCLALFMVLSISLTSATNHTATTSSSGSVENGYKCLEGLVKNKTTLSLQEATFAMLAIGGKGNLQSIVESNKKSNEYCWPKEGCKLKETAQVSLAYQAINHKDSANVVSWLSSKNASASDLTWYLEIDIQNKVPAECTLRYDGQERKINVLSDMRLDGAPGACFGFSSSGYWLLVRENCFEKEFQISCNQDFITALLYEKKTGGTVYVSSETHSASSLGTTNEKVTSKCFKLGTGCDYEGSLWSALALQKSGKEITAYIPYLLALAENNQGVFPSAFLHILIGGEDQYSEIVQNQKQGKYWELVGTPYNRFYDTSLALLGLKATSSTEAEQAKTYLLSIQTKEGCWNNNNIRDTAFILYSGWPKAVSGSSGTGTGGATLCESASSSYSCSLSSSCIDAGGRVLNELQCPNFGTSCCSVKVAEKSCKEQAGVLCASNQRCEGRTVSSGDSGTCCLDACINVEQEVTCELFGGICSGSCSDSEEVDTTQTCTAGNVCCQTKTQQSSGSGWIWVLIFAILIVLVIIAILKRDKLRVWWYKFKGKAKVTPIIKPGSPGPGGFGSTISPGQRGPPPRGYPTRSMQPPSSRPGSRRPSSQKDKDMEETLRKLREMSK